MHSDLGTYHPLRLEPDSPGFRWSAIDETTDGRINFVTTLDAADLTMTRELATSVAYKMICMYIITRLSGKTLGDALEALSDLYRWQLEKVAHVPRIQERKRHGVEGTRRVERPALTIEED